MTLLKSKRRVWVRLSLASCIFYTVCLPVCVGIQVAEVTEREIDATRAG